MSKYSAIRRAIKEDHDHICQFCFEEFPANRLQIHHILRRRDGGDNQTDNLIPFCGHCHCIVHKHNYTHNSRGERIMYIVISIHQHLTHLRELSFDFSLFSA
ncbi:MAG: HNH endonuclease [Minisyncoccia bacterium]